MSRNKQTVEKYMRSYNDLDHEKILACLTDDVEWILPGAFHLMGKTAFANEIDGHGCYEGKPEIVVRHMWEENDTVIAEGKVKTTKKGGEVLSLAFCDIFDMQEHKVRRLTSYLMPESESA